MSPYVRPVTFRDETNPLGPPAPGTATPYSSANLHAVQDGLGLLIDDNAEQALALINELTTRIDALEGAIPPITPGTQVWPIINTSVLGSTYAPLAYPIATTKRFIHAQNGNDTNDGLSWSTPWKSLYQAWQTVISDPGGQGIEIWCDGIFDLTNVDQYYPSSGQLLIANVIDGTITAPRSVRALPGCKVINGYLTLRTPNYNRFSGFEINGGGVVSDQCLKIESASATAHFEHSYNKYMNYKDQAVLIETGLGADFHGYCNDYTRIGNYRHPDGTRGHFDQPIYVKKCPRYLEINPIFHSNIGGYGFHAYDGATSDPANGARMLHATSLGTQPFGPAGCSGNISSSSPNITNAVAPAGKEFRPGQVVLGIGIPANAQIDSITGSGPYTLIMSANATANTTGLALTVHTPSSGFVIDNGQNITIANSIFKDYHGSGVNASVMGRPGRWINTTANNQFRYNLIHNCLNSLGTQAGVTEIGTIASDPQIVSLTDQIYSLLAGSPAKNSGEPWGVLVDHYGRPRSSIQPSIGAVE